VTVDPAAWASEYGTTLGTVELRESIRDHYTKALTDDPVTTETGAQIEVT